MNDLDALLEGFLDDEYCGWSMGQPGAVAEFARAPGERVRRAAGSATSARGGIRLRLPAGVTALAYETPVGPGRHWNHAVALCVPEAAATGAMRGVVTELGPDSAALRDRDAGGVLFDLGLALPAVDVCVRTADPAVLGLLRSACGTRLFAPGSTIAGQVVAAGPHRVFTTACGRVEVYTAIPPPEGRSPAGPHTHLLPAVLRAGRTHAATVPVPVGQLPCAHLYPAHPLTDVTGAARPFDADRAQAFEHLLAVHGDGDQRALAAAVVAAVRAGHGPEAAPRATTAPARAAVAVALRKLAHAGAPPGLLERWRSRTPEPESDPDGDRNAG